MHDLFEIGHVDKAIFQPTYLSDFYVEGFNTTARNAVLKEKHPDKFILNTSFDPRYEQKGLEEFEQKVHKWNAKGVKLYTAEWKDDSKGWKLTDEWALKHLQKCLDLGVTNIHVHKGPTIWPLNKDAFDVSDVDDAATTFTDLNFIVEHVGLPRLEDFCWIAVQEPNVFGGLAVAMPFIHTRPRYFANLIGELLYWAGDRPDPVRKRLRTVAAGLAGGEVRRLSDPRGHAVGARSAHPEHQAEDPRCECGKALRHPARRNGCRR